MEQMTQFVVVEAEAKENASEFRALEALEEALAIPQSTTEYIPEWGNCQIDFAPDGGQRKERAASAAAHSNGSEYSTEADACQIGMATVFASAGNEKAAGLTAAQLYGTEYSTELNACQIEPIPTLEGIEAIITGAARQRIETTYREVEDTRARIERERTARNVAIGAIQDRLSQTKATLEGLADERAKMEARAKAFLTGADLKAVLEKIHLAFNAKQLELEAALTSAEIAAAEARVEGEASSVTDALELQLVEQELERLQGVAPEVANSVRLTATVAEKLDAALQALQEGMIQDAEVLLEQAKAGQADPVQVAEVEQALAEARKAKLARDFIARVSANPDHLGAVRRIHRLMEEARQVGVAHQIAPFANKALDAARDAANARFAQARPIADHLAAEGFIPVVGDGRIEVWKEVSRNGNGVGWSLDRILSLRGQEGWVTETPRNPITRKELPPRVRHSRWFHMTGESTEQ